MSAFLRGISGLLRFRASVVVAIGLFVFAGIQLVRTQGWLVSWELGAFDAFLRLRPALVSEPSVALVWIQERDFEELGYPLPDHVLAAALRAILDHGPRAVGVDVYRDRPVGEGWEDLREIFLANPNLAIVEKLADPNQPGVAAPPFLGDRPGQVGFADIASDPDGVLRRGLLYLWDDEGRAYVSLSLLLAAQFLHAEGIRMEGDPENPDFVRLGPTTIPPVTEHLGGYRSAEDGGYQYVLDYRRPNGSFPQAGLGDVLAGAVDPALLRDRVVILGTASPSVKDYFQTPSGMVASSAARVFGAEHHAHAVDQQIRFGRGESVPFGSWTESQEGLWVLGWCLLGSLLGIRVRSPLSLLVTVVGGLGALLGGAFWAFGAELWIPVVPVALGWLGSLALGVAYVIQQERADRANMMSLFGRYVSHALVDRIWEQRHLFMEGGRPRPQRITVTVMLTDLIGYTTTAETKEPADVMDWIGTYMDRMASLIEEHGGMVNDFLGDGIMASFGVPVPSTTEEEISRDALAAVDCAIAMGRALEELNEHWRRAHLPTARMRVGILTGTAVVGDIGSQDRLKYATVGNTVNTAARLESFDKLAFEDEPEQSTCRVLVGEPTLERLSDRFATRCLGAHLLKGKGKPVTIYRVLERR